MLFLVVIWVVLYIWTVGALCAWFQGTGLYSRFPEELARQQRQLFATDLAASCIFALLPPVILIAPFLTAGYLYGWRIWPPRVNARPGMQFDALAPVIEKIINEARGGHA